MLSRAYWIPLWLGIAVLLVGSGVRAQTDGSSDRRAVSDAALRQRILRIYPQSLTLPVLDHPQFNPPSDAKTRLGQRLFFDPYLSRCGTVACASCHQPDHGYASPHPIMTGCDGVTGRRRVPSLFNVGYQSHFFWDGRLQSLEQQALFPVVSKFELANSWDVVLTYLRTGRHEPTGMVFAERQVQYADQFAAVFKGSITPVTVSYAIAAYERTVISRNAPFDRWLVGEDAALTSLQKRGLDVFFGRANCAVCHPPPLFMDQAFHNIGVPQAGFETPDLFPLNETIRAAIAPRGWAVPADVDLGRQETLPLRSSAHALGAFKTPTLRNVTLHQPYMHNGAFATLEEVMRHYVLLAADERQPLVGKLAFYVRYRKAFFGREGGGSPDDISAMVAFMQALTSVPPDPIPRGSVSDTKR